MEISLPLEAQHHILVCLQTLLEEACYTFGKRNMPDSLHLRGWDCAAAVELNRWMEELKKKPAKLACDKTHALPLDDLFRSIANIRHAAVHRQHVGSDVLERFLTNAESLTILLGVSTSLEKVRNLRQRTLRALAELRRSTRSVREKFESTMSHLEIQREMLKQMENSQRVKMENECRMHQSNITLGLKSLTTLYDADDLTITNNSSASTCPSDEELNGFF